MKWKDCQKHVVRKRRNQHLIRALIKQSDNKSFASDLLPLLETTAAAKIVLSYDAMHELITALALQHGLKILNHICYAAFIAEKLKKQHLAERFDNARILRNKIDYYGEDVTIRKARNTLHELAQLRDALLKII